MKTIEGDIYEAFAKAGAILQANAADPGKVQTESRAWQLTFIDRAAFSGLREPTRECMLPEMSYLSNSWSETTLPKSLIKSMPSSLPKFGYGASREQTTHSIVTFTAIRESTNIFFPATVSFPPSLAARLQNTFCQSKSSTESPSQRITSGIQFLTQTFFRFCVDILQTGKRIPWKIFPIYYQTS